MKKIFLIISLLFVSLANSQTRSDFNIHSTGGNSDFVVDDNGTIHIVWGNLDAYYAALVDSENFLYQPRIISNSIKTGKQPHIQMSNGKIAVGWASGDKPPVVYSYGSAEMKIISDGKDLTSEFIIDDQSGEGKRGSPSMIWLNDSTLIAAWNGIEKLSSNSQNDIYSQKVIISNTTFKTKFTSDQLLCDNTASDNDFNPQIIKMSNSENYLVVWTAQDELNKSKISCTMFSSEFSLIQKNVQLISLPNNDFACTQKVLNTTNGFAVVWTEVFDSYNNVYIQEFSNEFLPLTEKIHLNDEPANKYLELSAGINSTGKIIVVWESGTDIKAQRLDRNFSKIGNNFKVNKTKFNYAIYPSVKLTNNLIYTSWESNTGIWMNILDFDNPVGVEQIIDPVGFSLLQNYPNPFNPTTKIKYSLAEQGIVSLNVFDILGREVATLVNEIKSAGIYEVTFDASKLSSGIYCYKLQSGSFCQMKKLILIK